MITTQTPEEAAAVEAVRALPSIASVARVLCAALRPGWLCELCGVLGHRAFPLPGKSSPQTAQSRRALLSMNQG